MCKAPLSTPEVHTRTPSKRTKERKTNEDPKPTKHPINKHETQIPTTQKPKELSKYPQNKPKATPKKTYTLLPLPQLEPS